MVKQNGIIIVDYEIGILVIDYQNSIDDLYIPPHHFSTTKRFPLFSFPRIWNEEPVAKFNPSLRVYLKSVKSAMLNAIVV